MSTLFNSPPHTLFTQQIEVITHNRLFLDDLIQDGADLHGILNKLHSGSDLDTLEVRINSGGGFVRYGQQFINVIKDKFHDRCVTIIDAEASSMAALIFMAGSTRIIYPHSVLMVHDVSMYMTGKANETRRQMETYVPTFKKYFEDLFEETMSNKEVEALFNGQDFWFGAEEMCARGMADFVIVDGINTKAKDYLKSLGSVSKKKKKKKKFSEVKSVESVEPVQPVVDLMDIVLCDTQETEKETDD